MNLRERRAEKGMTQSQLADACGIKRTRVANYETGTRNPKPATAKKIAAVLGFDWTEFYADPEPETEPVQ